MSLFTPTTRYFDPQTSSDETSAALVQALSRRFNPVLTWSLPRTLVLGVISGGVLPMIALTRRFRNFCDAERHQLAYLDEWTHGRVTPEESRGLISAETLRFRDVLGVATLGCAVAAVVVFIKYFQIHTFGLHGVRQFLTLHDGPSQAAKTFTILMIAGFGTSLLQLNLHIADVKRFSRSLRRSTQGIAFAAVDEPRYCLGLRPFWTICGIILAICGAVWALPMMLAAGAHRSYIIGTGRDWRRSLASAVRGDMLKRSPDDEVPMPRDLPRLCSNKQCRAVVSRSASFCPHCGTPAGD